MTMYFMPASFASLTHSSALNFTGLNCVVSFSYSLTGTVDRNITHSPRPSERLPFHWPAGIAYKPQWMNRPYFASRNHSRRFSRAGSAGRGLGDCASSWVIRNAKTAKTAEILFIARSEAKPRRELNQARRGGGRVDAERG